MRVLVLSSSTGGGHNSAAKAIKEGLEDKKIDCDFKEYLEIVGPHITKFVNQLYIKSTKGKGSVFKTVYKLGELYQKTNLKSPVYRLNSLNKNRLYEYIKKHKYDYIIATHLFAAQALTTIKKTEDIHFMAVATDYVCIPFWEETNPDYFVIPHEDLESDFIQRGIAKEKLLPMGIPVSKRFDKLENRDELKKKMGLNNKQDYILILTGSMGFGNVVKMVRGLLNNINKSCSFIVACGNNQKLFNNIQTQFNGEARIIALSYTEDIDKYMKISQIVLTKPGGLTTTEIATLNKPMIHTMPIPGCENYNANFFEQRGMSIQCHNEEEVIEKTEQLLSDTVWQKKIIENQRKYIHGDAREKICEKIIEECKKIKG